MPRIHFKIPKQAWLILPVVALVVCAGILWRQRSWQVVYAGSQPVLVEYARTENERRMGLSNRPKLENGRGMLFVLDRESGGCMWMKDMNFPLDVYWYSSNKRLVSYKTRVSPSTYPKIFCPDIPASYMLEVNAGQFTQVPTELKLPANQ